MCVVGRGVRGMCSEEGGWWVVGSKRYPDVLLGWNIHSFFLVFCLKGIRVG